MIVFLNSDKNPFTTYLNPPIKAHKVRLISCSLYNSWYNLIVGMVTVGKVANRIPDSHYTPQTLAKALAKHGVTLKTGLPHKWEIRGRNSTQRSNGYAPINVLLGTKMSNLTAVYHWKIP